MDNIKQKIKLTEKIVKIIKKIKVFSEEGFDAKERKELALDLLELSGLILKDTLD
jgi:hypothetical protein